MSYKQKLADPRWQRKRLEILNRDNFQCTHCGDKESEIHVHHSYYEFGKEIWDYEDSTLFTLCSNCHYGHTISQRNIKEMMRTIQYDQLYEFEKIVKYCQLMNPYELDLVNKLCEKIINEDGTSL
jgi:5-methylcytosine-specific restriction endonuclease McrA